MPRRRDYRPLANKAIEHCIKNGLDDVLPLHPRMRAIEHDLLLEKIEEIRPTLSKQIIKFLNSKNLQNNGIGMPTPFYLPKSDLAFRRAHYFDIIDCLKFTALTFELNEKIIEAQSKTQSGRVWSTRIGDDGNFIKFQDAYKQFRSESAKKGNRYPGGFKIVTDISNFFDRISLHFIENTLFDMGCTLELVKFVDKVLTLFSRGRSFGIPVGGDASRILSEAALYKVDLKLQSENIDYIRFVDDFRIFSKTRTECINGLMILTDALTQEGLSLNHSKTHLLRTSDEEDGNEFTNRTVSHVHERLDLEKREPRYFVTHTVSGSPRVSKRYVRPGPDAIERLRKIDPIALLSEYSKSIGTAQERNLRDLVKYTVFIDWNFDRIKSIISIKISSIIYIVDAFIKESDRIPFGDKSRLTEEISDFINWKNCPWPFRLPIIELASSQDFFNESLLRRAMILAENDRDEIYRREAYRLGLGQIDATEMRRMIDEGYQSSPPHLRRVFIEAVYKCQRLPERAKAAILKNLKSVENDCFVQVMFKPEEPLQIEK